MGQDAGRVSLGTEATLSTVDQLKASLLEALEETDKLEIDLGELAEADLNVLQLLISAEKEATEHAKVLCFTGEGSTLLADMAKAAGIPRPDTADDSWPW